ncbi:SagB-type dehydrogenase family enzyme [Murinocardiopsis flavida]|uniref:SagB-type dehydrogenase family enzyme n=1 Tax=Murinocardiopsis flavida TaxID=645275 RepID=A0A2P8DKN2_9ACTN|nr:SagB/ThcOx family dehydrogenase [Murinocardiopsis flavida]PSK97776.1 SagB-type dehydrogenase family enzyme [Murinocardiopsis flavida]
MRLRRARTTACFWRDGRFAVTNYLTGDTVRIDPAAAAVLTAFDGWTTVEDAAERLGHDPADLAKTADALCECALLFTEDDPRAAADDAVAEQWRHWAPAGPLLHFGTRNLPFAAPEEQRRLRAEVGADQRAPMFKSYPDADRILLPRRPLSTGEAFDSVLYRRRTHRAFAPGPVPRVSFATLLAAVFGPSDFVDSPGFGAMMLRTSAAGGARQEIEAYVAVLDVADVPAGFYHYNPREHALELLTEGADRAGLNALCAGQEGVSGAGFAVFLTGVIGRMSAKYRTARAYRVMLMNAGHLGQTFALTATALGLGPFQTAAFDDAAVEAALGVDGVSETALYVLAAGVAPGDPMAGDAPQRRRPAGPGAFRLTL